MKRVISLAARLFEQSARPVAFDDRPSPLFDDLKIIARKQASHEYLGRFVLDPNSPNTRPSPHLTIIRPQIDLK
jgi:hypothetical protein